jgi:thioredoxin-dependent peroxiredoxin
VSSRPQAGDRAPALRGPSWSSDGTTTTFDLAAWRGGPVVVAFYPADDSPVCTRQLNAYSAGFDRFAALDARVVAVSPQSIDSHRAFAQANGGFAFPLVADVDKAIATDWGVLGSLGFYRRSAFVVDADGVVRYAHRSGAGLSFKGVDDLVAVIAQSR